MADLTEKDLEQRRERNTRLREQIAEAEAKAADQLQSQNRAIEAAGLDAETARLEARLAAAKQAAKVSNTKAGAAGPLAAVTDQLKAAQAGGTPPGVAVDTNGEADETKQQSRETTTVNQPKE